MATPAPGVPAVPSKVATATPAPAEEANDAPDNTDSANDGAEKKPEQQGQQPLTPMESLQIQQRSQQLMETGMKSDIAQMIARDEVMLQRALKAGTEKFLNALGKKIKSAFSKKAPEGGPKGQESADETSTFSIGKLDDASEPQKSGFDHKGIIMDKDSAYVGDNTVVSSDGKTFMPGVYKRNPESGELEKVDGEEAKKEYEQLTKKHDELMNGDRKGQKLDFGDNSPSFTNLTEGEFNMSRDGPDNKREFAKDISKKDAPTSQLTAASEAAPAGSAPVAPKPTFSREAEDVEPEVDPTIAALSSEHDDADEGFPQSKPALAAAEPKQQLALAGPPKAAPKPQMTGGM